MKKFQQAHSTNENNMTVIDFTYIAEYNEVFGLDGEVLIQGDEDEFLFVPDKNQTYYWSKSQNTWKIVGWNK